MKILITGGTNGMGKGVAKILAKVDNQTHEIIILCRSRERGEATIAELKDLTGNNKISIVVCDLEKLSEVKHTITELQSRHDFLDGIFINAGLGYLPKQQKTADGLDPHFQVNYLSQFMLVLNLLPLLEKSKNGPRVIFNAPSFGKLFWDDLQMDKKWGYERGVGQGMVAKRYFYTYLHNLITKTNKMNISFYGFEISKTVWSNQLTIIPPFMKFMATVMKLLGSFISIEKCGEIMAPLFTETPEESITKSGKLYTWKKGKFIELKEKEFILDEKLQPKLWDISLELCNDQKTTDIGKGLQQ